MDRVYIVITLDCERPRTETNDAASGPRDWKESEASIRGYVQLAREHGYSVSTFLHPEVAVAHASLLLELEAGGTCIDGLHLHPWKFGDGKYGAHLGSLSATEQCAVISEAIAVWQSGLSRRPLFFRPGTFSANDHTFRVLADLGFRGGSVSVPGRVYPDLNAIWTGCPPDPHRTHPSFRQMVGPMEFANMPLTVDMSHVEKRNGRAFHKDLRPDDDGDFQTMASNIVKSLKQRSPDIPVINMVTHNDNDFTDESNRVRSNYMAVLSAITDACHAAGLQPVSKSIADICDLVLAQPIYGAELVHV